MADKPLRAGIVGTGGIAGAHARGLREHAGRVELVAGVDIDRGRLDKFCDTWDIPGRYLSLTDMLEQEELDIVHLCTPPGFHAPDAIEALRAGVTVLTEKPPCVSLEEFDRIVEAEKESTGHFVGIFQHRFGTAAQTVKRLIDAGSFGRPLVGICNTLWYRDDAYYDVEWRGRWDTEGGGPTMGHGIHQIDLFAHLLGDWDEISAHAPRLARNVETEDMSVAFLTFQNGAVGSIVNSILSPREVSYLRFDFSEATLELTHLYGHSVDKWQYTPVPGIEPQDPPLWPPTEPEIKSGHAAQIGELLTSLENGEVPATTGQSLRRTMEIVTGIYASSFTGQRVKRDDLVAGNPYYHHLNGKG